MSASPLVPLLATMIFTAGLFVITRLERWADLVGGVLGLVAVGLMCAVLLAVTPAGTGREARGRQALLVDPVTGAEMPAIGRLP
ncbi:hypothetical protein [Methylobacterium isbiliense]|uniref:Uncharacterized protein n=1 Tax=Methylobacterium isbiliense TaxID=315478 RepID=A0ABQ4SL02_9HYPH|nr:hypothetical protein [Methylobacterium isbiliense]MDN3624718.1 hypothetical protein [Methylobacterium isbiliense]GJE02418.1 hypothetical protein GMJLKIPL_4367 [Methylobacterium isbiliense]